MTNNLDTEEVINDFNEIIDNAQGLPTDVRERINQLYDLSLNPNTENLQRIYTESREIRENYSIGA